MSESNEMPSLTDAELAARYAAEALQLGRYELGSALAHLAKQAARAAGQPRPTDLATAAAAQRDLFGAAPAATEDTAITPSARCAFTVGTDTCHQVIWWEETPGAVGHTGAWHHMDPSLDAHHEGRPYASTLGE
jgi:hypothetical protein